MKKASTLLIGLAGSVFLTSNVLAYQSNSGAGTTTQPSMQYQRQVAEQQRQKNTYYYQAMPAPSQPRTTYGHVDRTMGSLGFAPSIAIRPSSAPPAPTAAQIGSRLIESNPKWAPYVAGAAATGFVASGLANSVMAGGSVASAIAQPATAPAALPSAALRSGMAANSFISACKAGAWLDYAARVKQQQACLPYPGMK